MLETNRDQIPNATELAIENVKEIEFLNILIKDLKETIKSLEQTKKELLALHKMEAVLLKNLSENC